MRDLIKNRQDWCGRQISIWDADKGDTRINKPWCQILKIFLFVCLSLSPLFLKCLGLWYKQNTGEVGEGQTRKKQSTTGKQKNSRVSVQTLSSRNKDFKKYRRSSLSLNAHKVVRQTDKEEEHTDLNTAGRDANGGQVKLIRVKAQWQEVWSKIWGVKPSK